MYVPNLFAQIYKWQKRSCHQYLLLYMFITILPNPFILTYTDIQSSIKRENLPILGWALLFIYEEWSIIKINMIQSVVYTKLSTCALLCVYRPIIHYTQQSLHYTYIRFVYVYLVDHAAITTNTDKTVTLWAKV